MDGVSRPAEIILLTLSWADYCVGRKQNITKCNLIDFVIAQNNHELVISLTGPRQANLVLIAYASSEGSGEPAHPRSLAITSAACSYKQGVKRTLQTESQIPGPSEWLGMHS